MKSIVLGLWASLVSLISFVAIEEFRAKQVEYADPVKEVTESWKTREINVPQIINGVVKGYLVVQLLVIARSGGDKNPSTPIDAFVIDEVHRYLYGGNIVDISNTSKIDIKGFASAVVKAANARLGKDIVGEIAVQEFMFMPSSELKQRPR